MIRLIVTIRLIFLMALVYGQLPSVNYQTDGVKNITFLNQGDVYLEVPPWIIPGGWRTYTFSTFYTGLWATPESIADPVDVTIDLNGKFGPHIVTSGDYWWFGYKNPLYTNFEEWRRNYNGIFSAHYYNHPTKGYITIVMGKIKMKKKEDIHIKTQLDRQYPLAIAGKIVHPVAGKHILHS